MRRSLCCVPVLFAVVTADLAAAPVQGTPATTQAKPTTPPPPPPIVVRVTGDFGFVSTGGNSSVQSLNVGDKITIKGGKTQITQQFSVVHGRSKGKTVTSLWRASLRADYQLPSVFGSYLSVNYERNTFSGLASRVVTNAGLTAHVIRQEKTKLSVESGLNLTAENKIDKESPSIDALGGRAAFVFNRRIGDKAGINQTLELLPNFKEGDKLRINTETALTSPLTKQVGLKLSFVVRYDGKPSPTYQKTDRIFTSGITVSF